MAETGAEGRTAQPSPPLDPATSVLAAMHAVLAYRNGSLWLDEPVRGAASIAVSRKADHLVIDQIAVRKDCRGRGQATRLLAELCRYADHWGVDIALDVHPTDIKDESWLRKWYQSHGFEPNPLPSAGGYVAMTRPHR